MAYQVTDIGEAVSLWKSSGIKFLIARDYRLPRRQLETNIYKAPRCDGGNHIRIDRAR